MGSPASAVVVEADEPERRQSNRFRGHVIMVTKQDYCPTLEFVRHDSRTFWYRNIMVSFGSRLAPAAIPDDRSSKRC